MNYFLTLTSPTSDGAVLLSKLVDGMCHVKTTIALVDLAVRSFLRNSRKYGLGYLKKTPLQQKDTPYRLRSHKRIIGLNPLTCVGLFFIPPPISENHTGKIFIHLLLILSPFYAWRQKLVKISGKKTLKSSGGFLTLKI